MTPITRNTKVAIGYCSPEYLSAYFAASVQRTLLAHPGLIVATIAQVSGPRIATARNEIVQAFLDHPASPSWLWMLDADMTFTSDTLPRLLEAADRSTHPIVSGLAFIGRPNYPHRSNAMVWRDVEDQPRPILQPLVGIQAEGEWGPVVKVHAVGASCLLMHRDALVRIGDHYRSTGYPWFAETVTADGVEHGEDVTFCLRAGALGIPVYCHTGVILGHMKVGVVDETTFAEYLGQEQVLGDEGIKKRYEDQLRARVEGQGR